MVRKPLGQIRRLLEKMMNAEEGSFETDVALKERINKHVETIIAEIQVRK